jgi:hypothetical protein
VPAACVIGKATFIMVDKTLADNTFSFSKDVLQGIASRVLELARQQGATQPRPMFPKAWARR